MARKLVLLPLFCALACSPADPAADEPAEEPSVDDTAVVDEPSATGNPAPPTDPVDDPVERTDDPLTPPEDPVEPPEDPVEPPEDPVEPPEDPVEPPEDPVQGVCITETGAGHHVFACASELAWDVEVPPQCVDGGCGLILDMHGWTMTADKEDANTTMRALGIEHGYVILQPTAPGMAGGAALPTWVFDQHPAPVFDVVLEADALFGIDPKRRHSMGFSQGGHMTWRMLCEHAEFWASVAPLAGVKGCEFAGDDMPSVEVDVLVAFGHKDAILNFEENGQWQIDQMLAGWPFGAGEIIEEAAGHKATRYVTDWGTVLEFWEHDYASSSPILGGHCFPGSADVDVLPLAFGCAESGTFHLGELVMEFFLAHPKP